jgi:hypothetical protein
MFIVDDVDDEETSSSIPLQMFHIVTNATSREVTSIFMDADERKIDEEEPGF